MKFTPVFTKNIFVVVSMAEEYCYECGGSHRSGSRCNICGKPPCRCGC